MADRDRGSGSSAGEVEVDPRRPPTSVGGVGRQFAALGSQAVSDAINIDPAVFSEGLNRQLADTGRITGGGQRRITADQRQRVEAAVAFHLGGKLPGVEWTNAVDPITDRVLDLTGDNPQLISALEQDADALFALTDMQIAERVMRGQPVGQFGDVFDAVAEVSWEIGATDLAARLNAEQADSVKGTFDALTQTEALNLTLTGTELPVRPTGRVSPNFAKAQEFQTLFDVPGAWSFSPTSGVLAVTVGEQTVGIEARPGFDPDDHLDVMAEVVSAQADGRLVGGELVGGQSGGNIQRIIEKAHEVGAWTEQNPAARFTVDNIWKGLTLGEAEGLEGERQQIQERRETINEESIRLASAVPLPIDATVAAVARQIMGDRTDLGSQDALSQAAELVAENRDEFVAEFQSLTQEQLVEELEEGIEGQSPVGAAVEGTLENALNVFETWDSFTQTVGVNFIDAIRDLYTVADVTWEGGDWQDGFEALQRVIEAPTSDDPRSFELPGGFGGNEFFGLPVIHAADYFDLEGSWADTVNLAVGIGFDPINWLIPGARGVRAMARRALTNPKFAGLYLNTGSFPAVARSIAERTGAQSVRNVIASSSGMKADEIIDLMKIADDPEATVGQVQAVWKRALADDWIPDTAGRPIRHSTVEGVGRALDSIAEGKLPEQARSSIMQMVAKLSVSRSVRLGENQFLDSFGDLLVQFFPADKDKLASWFTEAATRMRQTGDPLALKGAHALQAEQARRAAWESGGAVRSINVGVGGDLRAVQQNIRTIERELELLSTRGLDETAEAGIRDQMRRMRDIMVRRADEAAPRMAEQKTRQRAAHKQLKQATYLENDVANQSRNQMGSLLVELYDDVAEQLNRQSVARGAGEVVPAVRGKQHPLNPDIPMRDWSAVTGVKKPPITDEDRLKLLMGVAGDDADVARGLDAIGAFNRTQKFVLPASPYEIIAYQKLAGNPSALAEWTKLLRSDWMKKWSRRVKLAFAANLLVNPVTAGKITLDETLRFLADTGKTGQFLRATGAGLPVVGRAVDPALGALGRGADQVVNALSGGRLKTQFGERVTNPYALAHKRNVGGWSADDFADYGWVDRPPKNVTSGFRLADYREQAERWVNGTLLQDRRFREYGRWIDEAVRNADGRLEPPQGFIDWWEHGDDVTRPGKSEVRETTVTIRDTPVVRDELTATDAFNIIDNAFENWLELAVDANQRNVMRREMLSSLRGARGPLQTTGPDARLLNAIERVPGLQGQEGALSRTFNVMFGGPSGRRAGVFYEHYFDEAMDILTERHAGRIIGVDEVMEAGGVDRQTAEHWLKQGADNRIVSQLITDTGAKTEAQLAARAAHYAERRADDLMYRFTSASLAGRGVESALMFPFARAQVDFLSWWSDYMTRPMNAFGRVPPQVRGRLPGILQDAMNTVDRIPMNLRAWAKFSHMASAVSNDHESVVDQTIDSLTFFPLRFDSEFMLDVSPQLGPMPSWLFDIAVDKGLIDEETEANFHAIFPALDFTELEGDPFTDAFNRVLPNSRRSLRDLGATGLRNAYALFGDDVFTTPQIGQAANFIADGKLPAATGDFQAALVADLLAIREGDDESVWTLTPGSNEWNERMNELAVEGALQANRSENWQDFRDRVLPVAEYDREYRALQAFEGMFDDRVFSDFQDAGVFQANELIEEDGQPRIKTIWDKYQEGTATPEDLAFLDDRLTTAYFEAGRVEILPGFSYLDFLNISNPEMAVNLINKSEDSGVPVRSDDHADFKNRHIGLGGRLQNVPPGDAGRELIVEARRRGWLVNRPVEEWATDASVAVYKSGQRAVRGVWEWVSHRTWQAGLKQSIEDKTFTLGGREAMILEQAGLTVEAGTTFSYGEFHEVLDAFDERFDVAQPVLIDTLSRGAVHSQLARHDDPFGQGLLDALDEVDKQWRDAGVESVEDWSEESKASVRGAFGEAINLGYTTVEDYEQEIEPIFGPIDYQPPTPPPVDELESGVRLSGDELQDVEVVDGDTVSVLLDDGPMRVRLIGINAPEVTQEGYSEARTNLARVVEQADEVVLGVYQPETFGLTQLTAPGEQRLLAWLYIDGVPIYSPDVFGVDNPRGAGTGGSVLDLEAILEAGR